MQDSSVMPSRLMILVALIQGLALLALHQAIEQKIWPHGEFPWLFSFYSIAIVAPLMLLLALSEQSRRLTQWILPYALLAAVLGFYVGNQVVPLTHIDMFPVIFPFVATMAVATFKALIYTQQLHRKEPLHYPALFQLSWRNFLVIGLSLLFTLAVWGVLMLWAALFKVIKITLFYDVFTESWFYYPVLAMAHGFGVIIFRQQYKVIDTITRIQQALMKYLLILLVAVSIIFLVTLPFTGLQALWDTGNGSVLILCMQGLMLFFVNAVYQDDSSERPYRLFIHRFISLGVLLLPIYSVISLYGLTLRIEQYGWTVERAWGIYIWSVFFLFSVGYVRGIVTKRDHWLESLSWVNVRMGVLVMATLLLMNTPILDFRKISVASQLARVEAGQIKLDELDINYFRYHLAKPGYDALTEIKVANAISNPNIVKKIDSLYRSRAGTEDSLTPAQYLETVKVREALTLPEGLVKEAHHFYVKNHWEYENIISQHVIAIDLNNDAKLDYVFLTKYRKRIGARVFYLNGDTWKSHRLVFGNPSDDDDLSLFESLTTRNAEVTKPEWQGLKIGEHVLEVDLSAQ